MNKFVKISGIVLIIIFACGIVGLLLYASIDDRITAEEYTEVCKQKGYDRLETGFNIFHKIDEKYYYKCCDNSIIDHKLVKSCDYYEVKKNG